MKRESSAFSQSEQGILARTDFSRFLQALQSRGYTIQGPRVHDGAVGWGAVNRLEDLPIGWRDNQHPGSYQLERTTSTRCFGIVHGGESMKQHTFAPQETLIVIERKKKTFECRPTIPETKRIAILGIRACDIAALAIQDRVFLQEQYPDPYYRARRKNLLLIAVNCTRAVETCFCASMGTGPKAQEGYDLSLTENDDDFLVRAGSRAGLEIFQELPLRPVSQAQLDEEKVQINACAASQTRLLDQQQLPQALYDAHDHSQWDEVATRCLACTNCTMVCPTCFCHTVEEQTDLKREKSEHVRLWDSCFTQNHGYIHGKNFRPTIKDRYRMWLTHKLGTWIDQFGTSGCVGCGRCITWCPVGIDLTQEFEKIVTSLNHRTS